MRFFEKRIRFSFIKILIGMVLLSTTSSGITSLSNISTDTLTPITTITKAFADKQSNVQVKHNGVITKILSDDTIGDRHQRMIVRLSNNQTLLITHNIDLAPRVPNPVVGKTLIFYGEYEWNNEGGVIHWTHKDPDGKHVAGWLEYEGKQYSCIDGDVSNVFAITTYLFTKRYAVFVSDMRIFNLLGRAVTNGATTSVSGICINKKFGSQLNTK